MGSKQQIPVSCHPPWGQQCHLPVCQLLRGPLLPLHAPHGPGGTRDGSCGSLAAWLHPGPGLGKRSCCLPGDGDRAHQALWDPGDEHQGHYTELASEGEVSCPLPSQDEGSLMGLGGLSWGDLPAPHPKTSQGSPRAAEGSDRRALPLQRGKTGRHRANASGFSPQTTTVLTSSGSATPCPVPGPPQVPPTEEDFGGTFSPLRPFRPLGPAFPGDP